MNEERLSEKQEAFLDKHNINSMGMNKRDATAKIGEIIDGLKVNSGMGDVVSKLESQAQYENGEKPEVVKMYEKHARPIDKPKTNGNVFKLTEESIRSNALRCAIEYGDKSGIDFWKNVNDFEEYIRHGK